VIKAIIFDNFGVLTTDMWRAFVDTLPPNLVDIARQINRDRDSGVITDDEFVEQIEQLTGRRPNETENLSQEEVAKNVALLDYIRELKPNYKIGMISNVANNWIRDYFLTSEEQALFDDMVFSFEAKITKPDPRIYHLACERLGVSLEETVMIDDVESYCQAAQAEGMKTVVYRDLQQMKQDLGQILNHT
jgi:epoxide hydrolase-like predicted phosphatase